MLRIPKIEIIENIFSISKQINNNKGKYVFSLGSEFPVAINIYALNYNFNLTPNYHEFLEIDYVIEGTGILNISNKKYQFNKGDILIIGNNKLHTFMKYNNENFSLYSLFFLSEIIYKPGGNDFDFDFISPFFYSGNNFNPVISKENNQEIFETFNKIFLLLRAKTKTYKLEIKFLLIKILLIILNNYKNSELNTINNFIRKKYDINRLNSLIQMVQEDCSRNITLNEAAHITYFSVNYFCNFFKRVTGCTFSEYILRIRLDKAKELLITENFSITEIGYRVGFKNLSYFFRKFKLLTNMSPKEFRNKYFNPR